MPMNVKACLAALAISLIGISASFAQAPDPSGCTPQERSNQTLQNSDQKNAGVICPPDVDPGMKAPTPKTGDDPVVAPPGMSGGSQSIQPK